MKFVSKVSLFIFIVLAVTVYPLISSDSTNVSYSELFKLHPKAGIGINIFQSSFSNFQGAVDCGLFRGGTGFGYSLGIAAEKEFFKDYLTSIGIYFFDRSGSFKLNNSLPIRDVSGTALDNIKSENQINVSLSFLEIEPKIHYKLVEELYKGSLYITTGLRLAIPLTSDFIQKDVILSPDYVYFLSTHNQERTISKGKIKTINPVQYGISLGIENELKVANDVFLTQELSWDYNFNKVCSDVDWSLHGIRLDIGLRFGIYERHEEIIKEVIPVIIPKEAKSQIVVQKPKLSLEFLKDSSQLSIRTGNELLATLPIVNAVFFETNSANISNKYILTDTTLPSLFYGDAIEYHKFILVRISQIIKDNKDARILLSGATSGTNNEPEGLSLATKRAENVKNTLIHLGVPGKNITITESLLPKAQSNQDYAEGILENQRVDIFIKNAPLQEYVGLQKFSEIIGDVKLRANFENIPKNEIVKLKTSFSDSVLNCTVPGVFSLPIKERLNIENKNINVSANLFFADTGLVINEQIELKNLPETQKNIMFDNFKAIIRFDYSSADLSTENKELLNQLASKLPENSIIIINGSADALGTERKNIQLAQQRASVTKEYLNKITENKFVLKIENNFKKFSEETAQGRFFNRSISIEIK